jgi:hypothetical protein
MLDLATRVMTMLDTVKARVRQQETLLTFGITGSEGNSGYSSVMRQMAVQKLLLEIARAPRRPKFLDAALRGTGVERKQLEELGLVRRCGNEYVIAFALFTREDVQKVRAVAEQATDSLVRALVTRMSEINAVLQQYDAPSVDPKAILYIVLGCFSLDWDGLDLTAEKRYRSLPYVTAGEGKFIPYAEEKSNLSLKGIYWGSHNSDEGEFRFTSFGDHFSLPRWVFPDLAWLLPMHAARDLPDSLRREVKPVLQQAGESMLHQVGCIMFALQDHERTLGELAGIIGMEAQDTEDLLSLLVELEYITRLDDRYGVLAPVLSARDGPMVQALRRVGWEVMEAWLALNYEGVQAQLSNLSAVRFGVPYADMFTQIWHYLFGTANRKLVECGMFADPYAHSRRYKGSIPVVWHQSLRDLR